MQTYSTLLRQQRQFFNTGATYPIPFRIEQLKQLKSLIKTYEPDIITALKQDLNKPSLEALLHEIILVNKDIDLAIKHLKQWAKPQKVATPFYLWPGHSKIYFEPYGCTFIIGPWNYPFLLIMLPLVGAISA